MSLMTNMHRIGQDDFNLWLLDTDTLEVHPSEGTPEGSVPLTPNTNIN